MHKSTRSTRFLSQLLQEKSVKTARFHHLFDISVASKTLTVRNLQGCGASKALSESLLPLAEQYGISERQGLQTSIFRRGTESSPEPWSIVFSYSPRSDLAWFDAPDQYESNERLGVAFDTCFGEINLKILKGSDSHAHLLSSFHGQSISILPLSNKGLKGTFFTDVLRTECSTKCVSFIEIGELFCMRDRDPVDTPSSYYGTNKIYYPLPSLVQETMRCRLE